MSLITVLITSKLTPGRGKYIFPPIEARIFFGPLHLPLAGNIKLIEKKRRIIRFYRGKKFFAPFRVSTFNNNCISLPRTLKGNILVSILQKPIKISQQKSEDILIAYVDFSQAFDDLILELVKGTILALPYLTFM